jgi:hypothetical protein
MLTRLIYIKLSILAAGGWKTSGYSSDFKPRRTGLSSLLQAGFNFWRSQLLLAAGGAASIRLS